MSNHICVQGTTCVVLGYDRPLNYVFCTVEISGEIIYTNIDDDQAGTECQDVEYFREILDRLDIQVPEAMFKNVQQDQINKVGNKVVHYKVTDEQH